MIYCPYQNSLKAPVSPIKVSIMSDQGKIWIPTQCDICGKTRNFNDLAAITAYFAPGNPDHSESALKSRYHDPCSAIFHCTDNAVCKHRAMEIAKTVRNSKERETALH